MSINLRVLVPEETTNYVKNPSPRYDTTGYTSVGSTMTRTLERSRFSIASIKAVTNGLVLNEGVLYRVFGLAGVQDFITASVYVRGAGKVRLRLLDNFRGSEAYTAPFTLNDDRWTRLEISSRCAGGDDIRLYVETADTAAKAITFYADGFQLERKPYATSYCDGSQDGCRWDTTAYSTTSSRDATSRAGGRWVALAGPCRPNNDIYVTLLGGFGMARVNNQTQPWSNASGSFFQNYKVDDRVLTLSFTVKKKQMISVGPPDPIVLHELRQQLIDIIKPDKTVGGEAFLFEYSSTESDRPLYIRARYDAGLEGSWDVRNPWVNSFPLRLLCVDPIWFEDDQEVVNMGISSNLPPSVSNVFGKINNIWTEIKDPVLGGIPLSPSCFENGPNNILYIGGSFGHPVSSPFAFQGICKWDGVNITGLGDGTMTGLGSFGVNSMAMGSDGFLYVTGNFSTIGGVSANRVARYDPATNTFSAMGTGLDGTGLAICVAPNGQVYVGGVFQTAGGVTCIHIARWDGLQWRTVGATSGFAVSAEGVRSIVNAGDGQNLYVGGGFLTSNGGSVTYNRVARVDISTNLIFPLGYGLSGGVVRALAVGIDGTLYAGGEFLASAAPSAAPLLRVAKYSGGQLWFPLGDGLGPATGSTSVARLAVDSDGGLYASGTFVVSGSREMPRLARWYGETWNPQQFYADPAVTQSNVNGIIFSKQGDLYITANFTVSFVVPANTNAPNLGSAAVYPILRYRGSGRLRYMENIKTGQAIFLDLVAFANEEITIDFAKGKITSDVRGDLSYAILPGSEIRSVYLLPGNNLFAALVTGDVNASMQLLYTPQHWSADAIVDVDEL